MSLETTKLGTTQTPHVTFPRADSWHTFLYKKTSKTVSNSIGDKYLFRGYLNVECYFLHDVNSFRKCFGHLLHTVKVQHWLLNITVLFQQFKLPWKQMINRRTVRYLHGMAVSVATANALLALFNLVSFLQSLTVKQWKKRLHKSLQTWKREELWSLAKPELEECVWDDVKSNRTYKQSLWQQAESTHRFSGWDCEQASVCIQHFKQNLKSVT